MRVGAAPLALDTKGVAFHIVTAVDGSAAVETAAESVGLKRFQTVLVAGAAGAYPTTHCGLDGVETSMTSRPFSSAT